MVCVALAGDPPGKLTVPDDTGEVVLADAVPVEALQATVRGVWLLPARTEHSQ